MKKVNVLSVELDAQLDEHGFRHAATSVSERLQGRRIGAGIYEAEAGFPIWPYHYHHGVEELLYVLTGNPVLREPAGERSLAPGDLVPFPVGPTGAHTVKGPGRFIIFDSFGDGPYLSVYPDSDKTSGPEGMLLRSSAVGYWHGEGTAGPSEPEAPDWEPPQPPARLAAAMIEASEPYHYVYGREKWLLVVEGTPTLRHADGEDQLQPGDLVSLPDGPGGAHELRGEFRVLSLSTTGLPANVHYPDSGQWLIRNAPGAEITLP